MTWELIMYACVACSAWSLRNVELRRAKAAETALQLRDQGYPHLARLSVRINEFGLFMDCLAVVSAALLLPIYILDNLIG